MSSSRTLLACVVIVSMMLAIDAQRIRVWIRPIPRIIFSTPLPTVSPRLTRTRPPTISPPRRPFTLYQWLTTKTITRTIPPSISPPRLPPTISPWFTGTRTPKIYPLTLSPTFSPLFTVGPITRNISPRISPSTLPPSLSPLFTTTTRPPRVFPPPPPPRHFPWYFPWFRPRPRPKPRPAPRTSPTPPADDVEKAKRYLLRFGHIVKRPWRPVTYQDFVRGLRSLQRFAGLRITGRLDISTRRLMTLPRCGRPDIETYNSANNRIGVYAGFAGFIARKKRYAAVRRWPFTTLRYRLYNYPSEALSESAVDSIINRAFKYWSDESCLHITEASYPHLKVAFFKGYHGDSSSFDGPGKVLAHAFLPNSGKVHFDDDETWTNGTTAGKNLLWVAAHEFGHALGLGHTSVKSAVMYPYYSGYNKDLRLDQDDIKGIRILYGYCPESTAATITTDTTDTALTPDTSTANTADTTGTPATATTADITTSDTAGNPAGCTLWPLHK